MVATTGCTGAAAGAMTAGAVVVWVVFGFGSSGCIFGGAGGDGGAISVMTTSLG